MSAATPVADFDSATAMLRALARYLRGEDLPFLGMMSQRKGALMEKAAALLNRSPEWLREQAYIWSGRFEAAAANDLCRIDLDAVGEELLGFYPRKRFPAAAIGSSNGAAVHLWAALGIPWLPQTLLIPVARTNDPDEPLKDAQWGQRPARLLLDANPDVQLHHMNDPVQDRLMIRRMTYFRVKRLRLGRAYEAFLENSLAPGATIFIVDCRLRWPTTCYGDRHYFQFGALGGASAEEYHRGGGRVEAYLKEQGSRRRRWEPPPPNGMSPEAEWGFEAALGRDVRAFAERRGYRIRRVIFDEPEHFSPDLYRWWNRRRGIEDRRLLVESFILMEPYWTIRTGSIPFWLVFNKAPSAAALERYLRSVPERFEDIYLTLFSHGVDSIGLVPIDEWRRIMASGARQSALLGMDERAFPRDFAVYARFHKALVQTILARYPAPEPLTLAELDGFLRENHGRYPVQWQPCD